MNNLGRYLYCVIPCREQREFGEIGIGEIPQKVYTLNHEGLALVVSNVPVKIYDPTRKNAMAHEKVIATVMKEFTVVPMSFGLVCKDRQGAKKMLTTYYQEFKERLTLFENKIELGLKVWWKQEQFRRDVFRENPQLEARKNKLEKTSGEKTYIESAEFGRKVQQAANSLRTKYQELVYQPLAELAGAAKLNATIGELMVLNMAFLVDKQREGEFDLKVNDIYLLYEDKLTFKYSGPWPPYNFVDLQLFYSE